MSKREVYSDGDIKQAYTMLVSKDTRGGCNIRPGRIIYTCLRYLSSSGTRRIISLHVIGDDNYSIGVATGEKQQRMFNISYYTAVLLNMRIGHGSTGDTGIIIDGAGMDMGFELVYNLGRVLFPKGFGDVGYRDTVDKHGRSVTIYKRPVSQNALIAMRSAGYKFNGRNGDDTGWDNDGGYALRHEWL